MVNDLLYISELYIAEKFQYKGWEYTGMDQDEEEEDLADDDDESEEEEDEEDIFIKEKKKPFGDTRNYCPVALKDDNVLWPGSPEFAAKYREKVYYFSTPDARTKFLGSPKEFLAENEPLKVSVSGVFKNITTLQIIERF